MSINAKKTAPDNGRLEGRTTPDRREEIRRAYPWLEQMFAEQSKCTIRILMVADGALDFGEVSFGLSELINKALKPSSTPWEEISITTAHRSGEEGIRADIKNFRFDVEPDPPYKVPFNIDNYDEVWLFGYNKQAEQLNLSRSELKVLSDFMEAGGGVFATGDHEDLGFALCGQVPRVRSMRKWVFSSNSPDEPLAPEKTGPTRIDTLREGFDLGFQSSDQSDSMPQEIRPHLFLDKTGKGSCPHPLLAYRDSAVKVFPDHMHEGECIVPKAPDGLKRTFSFADADKPKDEYPPLPNSELRLPPEIVAIATSAGGYLTDDINVFPVNPRCFAIVTAYDGHIVDKVENGRRAGGVGRVVVDATFHHFVNVNLNGTGSLNPASKGFYDGLGNPTKDYEVIKTYYRNIATWLCPAKSRLSRAANFLVALRYMSPLIEEIDFVKDPELEDFLYAGAVTRNAISQFFSSVEATQYALDLMMTLPEEIRDTIGALIDPWRPAQLPTESLFILFRSEILVKIILCGAMLTISKNLPPDGFNAAQFVYAKNLKQADFNNIVASGTNQGLIALSEFVLNSRYVLQGLFTTLNALSSTTNKASGEDATHTTSRSDQSVFASVGKSFAKENDMSFRVDGRWSGNTVVANVTRPVHILIGLENSLGNFAGWHEESAISVSGTSMEIGGHQFILITGEERETDGSLSKFRYTGEIVPMPEDPAHFLIIKDGKYRKRSQADTRSDDGEWTAQKPLT